MTQKMQEKLKNVPYNGDDAFSELKRVLEFCCDIEEVGEKEKHRLDYELEIVKRTDVAKIFLFAIDLIHNHSLATTMSIEGNSYINYMLGISNVNPVIYNLPFERFFYEQKESLPTFNVYVAKGGKASILKNLNKKYGEDIVVRGYDNVCNYFVSSKPIKKDLIKESLSVKTKYGEICKENVSVLTYKELLDLNFYSFGVVEVDTLQYSTEEDFLEERIFEKKSELFNTEYHNSVDTYNEIEEIKGFLNDTDYKLVYQEQFMEICNKFLEIDYVTADIYRRLISKRKKDGLVEFKQKILDKYKENGDDLFNYLYDTVWRSVSKAYVIANLYNIIDETLEEW